MNELSAADEAPSIHILKFDLPTAFASAVSIISVSEHFLEVLFLIGLDMKRLHLKIYMTVLL